MKQKRSYGIIAVLICIITVFMSFPLSVSADMGPKPSVRINFENMSDDVICYGTLLSQKPSTGPESVWDGTEENARYKENENYSYSELGYTIWKAFVDYKDADGYYFLQIGWQINETKQIAWTYYPPSSFKILLYYPETQTFAISDIYEKYAFDTYYTVDMSGIDIGSVEYDESQSSDERNQEIGSIYTDEQTTDQNISAVYDEDKSTDERINAYRSYNYRAEITSLIARIIITIIIEMIVALLFGFKKKKQLLLLICVNTITQIILNILLNLVNYNSGQMSFTVIYILLEIAVFIIEAIIYCSILKKISDIQKKNWFYVLYSFVANAISFAAGLIIAHLIPGIF